MRALAIILIVLGVLGFMYQGFTYWTNRTVVDAGPVQVTASEPHTVWIPPAIAGAAVIAGAMMLALGGPKD